MNRDGLSFEGVQLVSKEIMNAVDTLSKYYDIDLKYKAETENEIFYYANVCLSEWYKVNPHIKFVEIES